jgi:hypothetical protein
MPGPHRDGKGYYRLLQVALDASEEEIQLAYERIEELPDSARGAAWSEITRAYSVLKNQASRNAYDRMETGPLHTTVRRRRATRLNLNNARVLIVCGVLMVGILGFVWVPLYGSRFRTFTAGDALVTTQGAPFGTVVKSEEDHTFPTGVSSGAYLVSVHGTGELRWFPMNDIKSSCRRAN